MVREDFIADGIALVDRAEYTFDWFPDGPVVVGFRRTGELSLFFGEEEVYHFQPDGSFRRGFWKDTLLKAEHGRIVEMVRLRAKAETTLQRVDIDAEREAEHLDRLAGRLETLAEAVQAGSPEVLREVAASEGGATARLRDWLRKYGHREVRIAGRAGLGRRGK